MSRMKNEPITKSIYICNRCQASSIFKLIDAYINKTNETIPFNDLHSYEDVKIETICYLCLQVKMFNICTYPNDFVYVKTIII